MNEDYTTKTLVSYYTFKSFTQKRIGSKLLDRLKSEETELNGWVIDHHMEKKNNNCLYNSPLGFYMKNGFELEPHQRLETSNLSAVKIKWSRR